MDGKVSITITTDKPVKVWVTEDEKAPQDTKEQEGLKRLVNSVKGGTDNVVSNREARSSGEK